MRLMIIIPVCLALLSCNRRSEPTRIFLHGVASGDPVSTGVVIWTRVTPDADFTPMNVQWQLSSDDQFLNTIRKGEEEAHSGRDFTIKVDVSGLDPGVTYYYRFLCAGDTSPVGRTRTSPVQADSLQFIVVSCSHYEWGYFNAYKKIAQRPALDAVIHLGDYIYEYGTGSYGDTTIGRHHIPEHETVSLEDYRMRYAQYRSDPDLQAAHANHPFITVWDDHEIANDSYKDGAQNHQDVEGDYETRKQAAARAYYEWMPIREGAKLYRRFSFGNLADLLMLDERLEGRSKQVANVDAPDLASEDRSMLGKAQLEWLKNSLKVSSAKWRIIGNQVIFSHVDQGKVFPNRPLNLDSWNGYPYERNQLATFIRENQLNNLIWVTGDTHSSWAFETIIDKAETKPFAIEFGTPSVSSANYDEHTNADTAALARQRYLQTNPHLKYANLTDHGYMLLTIKDSQAVARYYYVNTLRESSDVERLGATVSVNSGETGLKIE